MQYIIIVISTIIGMLMDKYFGVKDPCAFWIVGMVFGILAGLFIRKEN